MAHDIVQPARLPQQARPTVMFATANLSVGGFDVFN
jgi:hypothetical protein